MDTKRKNMYKTTIDNIEIQEGFNIRVDYGDIEQLAAMIKESGVKTPINCYRKKDTFIVVDGHRRIKAIKLLQSQGDCLDIEIPINIRPRNDSDLDRVLDMYIMNSGKNLTILEEGKLYQRLKEVHGLKNTEIAKKVSKSSMHVGNVLSLLEAPQQLSEYIMLDLVSATTVIEQLKTDQNSLITLEKVEKALEQNGGARITKKHLAPFNKVEEPSFTDKMEEQEFESAFELTDDIPPHQDNTVYQETQQDPTEEDNFQERTMQAPINYNGVQFEDEIEKTLHRAIDQFHGNTDNVSKAVLNTLKAMYKYYRGEINCNNFLHTLETKLLSDEI